MSSRRSAPGSSGTGQAKALFALSLALAASGLAQDDLLRRAAELDDAHQCEEAERYYREALAKGAPSAPLLNNTGNHYLVCGQQDKAAIYFERLLKINPAHGNANLQMARIATGRKEGARALQYLSRVKDADPAIRLLRAEAHWYAGDGAAASAILDALQQEARGDARSLMALGVTCAGLGLYERAEIAFTAVLATHPDNFEVVFNLGRAAARAKHYDRAERSLEVALKLRPSDTDALLELGLVHGARQDYSRAVYILAQARQRAPQRPDVLLALARAAEDAGYYGDSILAYDDYLRVQPGDETARRDRARVCAATGTRLAEGLRELDAYVQRHPDDPIGHYNLAQFVWSSEPEKALEQLSAALRLNSRFAPAFYARGWLLQRLGRVAESLTDLRAAVRLQPESVRALDQLGLAYLSLDQPAEAEKVFRRAVGIAPGEPDALLHLGRALIALDRDREAEAYLAQFEKLRPRRTRDPRSEPGMIELATLSPNERRRREIERLRRDAAAHPGDPELQLHLAGLLLADGRIEEAAAAYRELLAGNADWRIWRAAGAALVAARQYPLGREFLERAATDNPAAGLDLAIALFFTEGPAPALRSLDSVPEPERTGDYVLMKARILDAAGRRQEAEKLLQAGLRQSASRADVAEEAVLVLLRMNRSAEALDVLDRVVKTNPDNPDLLLERAIVLAIAGRQPAAEATIQTVESRWPEWDRAYLAHGLLLESAGRTAEARHKVRTAVALGLTGPASRCALLRLDGKPASTPECACVSELRDLLLPRCQSAK